MTLRTLLLGSAGAILMVGGAQAADLGAEPVNYVKVCDAFGAGYYYAPGTDTCIKVGGLARFEIYLLDDAVPGPALVAPAVQPPAGASHRFGSYFELYVLAASMTEYGPMIGGMQVKGTDPLNAGGGPVVIDWISLQLGALSAGYNWSSFGGPAQWAQGVYVPGLGQLGANKNNYIKLSWATAGLGMYIAAEDYRGRAAADAAGTNGTIPDIVGGLSFGAGPIGFQVHAGWHDGTAIDSYGINGAASIDLGATGLAGSSLLLAATYSGGDGTWINGLAGGGTGYTLYGALMLGLTSQFGVLGEVAYTSATTTLTNYTAELHFKPVRNFLIAGAFQHTVESGANRATVRLQRNFP